MHNRLGPKLHLMLIIRRPLINLRLHPIITLYRQLPTKRMKNRSRRNTICQNLVNLPPYRLQPLRGLLINHILRNFPQIPLPLRIGQNSLRIQIPILHYSGLKHHNRPSQISATCLNQLMHELMRQWDVFRGAYF